VQGPQIPKQYSQRRWTFVSLATYATIFIGLWLMVVGLCLDLLMQ
jgi:hypothetical protein